MPPVQGVQVGGGNQQVNVFGDATFVAGDARPDSGRDDATACRGGPRWMMSGSYQLLVAPGGLVGRAGTTAGLARFVSDDGTGAARVLVLRGLGGMGKSAAVWSFLRHRVRELAVQPEIIVWWSFAELQDDVGGLLTRLAQLAPAGGDGVLDRAVAALRERRCLLVLDGLERQVHAYSSMVCRPMLESERAPASGVSDAGRGIVDPRLTRLLSEIRAGAATKAIVTSRLMPAELEISPGRPGHGVHLVDLPPLSEVETREFLAAFGVPVDRVLEAEIHRATGSHPLLLQMVARGLLAARLDPADIIAAVATSGVPDAVLDEVTRARSQLIDYILSRLSDRERLVAQVVAATVQPLTTAQIRGIAARLDETVPDWPGQLAPTLEQTLGTLEDLALLAREDCGFGTTSWLMHPVVRGAVAAAHHPSVQVVEAVANQFSAAPRSAPVEVRTVADLSRPISLFHALCDLARYDEAAALYLEVLHRPLTFQIREHQERLSLVQRLFPHGVLQGTPIRDQAIRISVFNAAALTYQWLGHNKLAAGLLREALATDAGRHVATLWSNLASILLYTDELEDACHAAITAIRRSPGPAEQSTPMTYLAMILRQTGRPIERLVAVMDALSSQQAPPAWRHLRAGDLALWGRRPDLALTHGLQSLKAALDHDHAYEAPVIEALRLVGQALVDTGDPTAAREPLREALRRAEDFVLLQEELPARVALAKANLDHSPEHAKALIHDGFDNRDPLEYRPFAVDAHAVLYRLHQRHGDPAHANRLRRQGAQLATTPPGWIYAHGLHQLGLDTPTTGTQPLPDDVRELLQDLEAEQPPPTAPASPDQPTPP